MNSRATAIHATLLHFNVEQLRGFLQFYEKYSAGFALKLQFEKKNNRPLKKKDYLIFCAEVIGAHAKTGLSR